MGILDEDERTQATPSGYAAGQAIRRVAAGQGRGGPRQKGRAGLAAAAADLVTRPTRALVNTVNPHWPIVRSHVWRRRGQTFPHRALNARSRPCLPK